VGAAASVSRHASLTLSGRERSHRTTATSLALSADYICDGAQRRHIATEQYEVATLSRRLDCQCAT
jgi:hypothetical protein